MDYIKILTACAMVLILGGCSTKISNAKKEQAPRDLSYLAQELPPAIPAKRSNVKAIDPFEGRTFTFAASEARVQTVLYAIAVDMGLNLVMGSDVSADVTISANFVRTPMKDAVNVVMDMADLYYEIQGNIMRVYRYHTSIFNLPYISLSGTHTASLGGDVVGGADVDGDTNLKGEFTLDYTKDADSVDFYGMLENNLGSILSTDPESSFTINKLTGIVSVHTTRTNFVKVQRLLDNVVNNATRQVQIEAKVIEVKLSDSSSYGIDWSNVFSPKSFTSIGVGQTVSPVSNSSGYFTISKGDFSGVLNLIAEYGKVDTLSNPRLTVMNGQSAMLTAGQITPFWNVEREESDKSSGTNTVTYTYEKYNVLDGVMIGVTAFIHDDGTVMLNIMPVTTSIEGTAAITEPETGIEMVTAPIVDIKELGTVVSVDSETLLVIGGLISTKKAVTTKSIPVLGDIPLLGYLFSGETTEYEKTEMVILIKPTVIYGKSKVVVK